jgi:hypothetical protein
MSTRTYNLRNRTETGTATQSRIPTRLTTTLNHDSSTHTLGTAPAASSNPALYSDVVAQRPPSPLGRKENEASVARSIVDSHSNNEMAIGDSPSQKAVNTASSESESTRIQEQEAPWTTVKRRRAQSLSSLGRTPEVSQKVRLQKKKLTVEQMRTVQQAEQGMTSRERDIVQRRQEKVPVGRESSLSSRGEGPSKPSKGKGIDPREWGNANISQDSLDIGAQAAALESIAQHKHKKRVRKGRRERHHHATYSRERRSHSIRLPAESRPVTQIAADSYLGAAFRKIGRPAKQLRYPGGGSPSSSGSETSDDSYTTSVTDSGSETQESDGGSLFPSEKYLSHDRRRRKRRGHHRRRRRDLSSSPEPTIKPIAPKDYDGKPDARSFHRFVRESEAYLRDGKVRGRRQIFLLSYHLTNKAYDFYTQKVSLNEEQWTLPQFYAELFNYCFPVDYRMQLRKNLSRCHQNKNTVTEYTHELQELFNMIGDIPERDKVLKFWNGA